MTVPCLPLISSHFVRSLLLRSVLHPHTQSEYYEKWKETIAMWLFARPKLIYRNTDLRESRCSRSFWIQIQKRKRKEKSCTRHTGRIDSREKREREKEWKWETSKAKIYLICPCIYPLIIVYQICVVLALRTKLVSICCLIRPISFSLFVLKCIGSCSIGSFIPLERSFHEFLWSDSLFLFLSSRSKGVFPSKRELLAWFNGFGIHIISKVAVRNAKTFQTMILTKTRHKHEWGGLYLAWHWRSLKMTNILSLWWAHVNASSKD